MTNMHFEPSATPVRRRSARLLALALAGAFSLLAATAQAQTWDYKSYKKTQGGQFSKDNFVTGTISLEEKDGKAVFRMNAGGTDACVRGDIPAIVTRTDATTTIEPQITLGGCELFRYVIRNDGSGGRREYKRGDKWINTGWDHGLTPVKK